MTDPLWPAAATLLRSTPLEGRRHASLLGVSTYTTSVTPRSWHSTPSAVREALARFSTWSYRDALDLADEVDALDLGDVFDPDGVGGTDRVAQALARASEVELHLVLGGDNAATFHALHGLAAGSWAEWGLVTLDAHLDLREGVSNGSPVRQLLEAGLDGTHVVQVGLSDFANSPEYARRARDAGLSARTRDEVAERGIGVVMREALDRAAEGGRHVYVDLDVDVVDRASVPGCPAALPGGLSARELREAARIAGRDPRVRAIDFTEVDVERDSDDQRTVRLVALAVLEALAGLARRAR